MTSTRKILKIFVASPGDLHEERRAIRNAAQEFNDSWAENLGYHVELLGWEDTLPGVGRPQHLINKDLDGCVFFIGMIWKRWGTPPSDDGEFTSGFEEEFERSLERQQDSGAPEIALFFKEIPDDAKEDPGPDLTRVMEFRQRIEVERKVLYKSFSSVEDMQRLARKSITKFVNQVRQKDAISELHEVGTSRAITEHTATETEQSVSSELQEVDEGFAFLEKLTEKFKDQGDISKLEAAEVARFRLLGNSVTTSRNDERYIGAHDLNLLFAKKISGTGFNEREVLCLAGLGFRYLEHQNVPLWSWYSILSDATYDPALNSSVHGDTDEEKIGAIGILRVLERDIPGRDGFPTKEYINGKWFSNESTSKVRAAALGYLRERGTMADFAVAQEEFRRNDIATSRAALECMIGLSFRHERYAVSRKLVLESQFESLNRDLLNAVLDSFESLDTPVLQLGLEHNNKEVRRRTVSILRARGDIDLRLAEQLARDSDALIRREALMARKSLGESFSNEEVKKILTEPNYSLSRSGQIGGAVGTKRDPKGQELYQQHELGRLKRLSESELTKRVESASIYDDEPYFARAERYFEKFADKLRGDIDDNFLAYFNAQIDRLSELPFGTRLERESFAKRVRNLEEFHRKQLTRQGLNILCRAGETQDLDRIRRNLQTGYAEASALDADYVGRFGVWTDIVHLAQAEPPMSGGSLLERMDSNVFYEVVAKAILKLGKEKSISNLFSVELPAAALKRVIELCASSRFSKISEKSLLGLFDHKDSSVRRAAAIKAVGSLSVERITSLLRKYVGSDKYRYYNVIHWLDLGASMSRDDVRKVTRAAIG